ncbi:unnamed protein product [Leptidea sinapis]|uniref:Protein krueppel n=1 Tax=Leptidea sinapis TaxID=189913 RepID=A0A5E4PS53_9NEOP|nr:unnamed protein product [Leptidea sinapis]
MTEENKATKERVSSEIGDRSNQSFLGDPLSAKHAVEMLLNDTLQYNVCRYCLHVTTYLRELDEILTMGGKDAFFEVTINDIIASVHPFKVNSKTNVLNKICNMCLDKAISCYLFAQQCEQSERALRNYFEEIIDKFNKLDPIEPVKKRGKRKINPNYNILFVEHENVIDFAEPIINIVNLNAVPNEQDTINDLECSKCWQVLPNTISLLNHEKSHPKSMWYHCRLCGKSFVRIHQYKRHIRNCHISNEINVPEKKFKCNECGIMNEQFSIHLQHVEKHKFKSVFECLIKQNLKCFCMICFGKEETLIDLNESMHFHGGYKELSGERSISSILTRVLPNITLINKDTKICSQCLNSLITSFIFITSTHYIQNRLIKCIDNIVRDLSNIDENKNVIIEIEQNAILPSDAIQEEDNVMREDVLEDEFRIEFTSESDESDELSNVENIYNPARIVTKTYLKRKVANGVAHSAKYDQMCSEFLLKSRRVSEVSGLTCPICIKNFISDYFLKKHIISHLPKPVACKVCNQSFKSKFTLFEHAKMMHILCIPSFSCSICNRLFKNRTRLQHHEKNHFYKKCLLCDKYFKSQKYFNTHLVRHGIKYNMSKRNVVFCSVCEKACSNENELSLHVNKAHIQMKPYSCDMCEKQFYTEYNLKCHKKLHNLYSREECKFCHRVFKCRRSLVIHLRRHIDIKPNACPVCSQTFYSESEVRKHMKLKHGGKFCCRVCRKVVDSNSDLKQHIKVSHSYM